MKLAYWPITTKSELLGVLLRKKMVGGVERLLDFKRNCKPFSIGWVHKNFPKNIKGIQSVTHTALKGDLRMLAFTEWQFLLPSSYWPHFGPLIKHRVLWDSLTIRRSPWPCTETFYRCLRYHLPFLHSILNDREVKRQWLEWSLCRVYNSY